jgi:hypothetical protein
MGAPLLAALALAAGATVPAPPAQRSGPDIFAVIVGNNASDGSELADLRYADDDAARYHELLSMAGGNVEILSVLDADTQRIHPEVAERARVPRRDVLLGALTRTFDAIRAAERAGRRTAFYFVYVGHGSIGPDGEGQMHLVGGRFTRSDLFQQVLAESPASVNHVIIDACNAYLMVARRGDTATVDAALDQFLAREDLSEYPNTGVLVSTSEATEVHEWSRFSAGVFSHEVRSALVGGADVDGDGRATYAEVRAFIAAANARIDNPKARLEVYAAAPRINLREPIFDRAWAPDAPTVRVPDQMAGRYFVEDTRGVRYADFNSSPDFTVTLTLVPQELYYLRSDGLEIRVPTGVLQAANAADLAAQPITLAMRGSESDAFRRNLFALPFGPAYFEGYRASLPDPRSRARIEAAQPERRGLSAKRVAALSVAGAGAASLVASLVVGLGVQDLRDQHARAIGDDDDIADLEGRIEDRVLATNLLLGAGIGLVVTGATLWLWPE